MSAGPPPRPGTASILAVGSELLGTARLDTNSLYLTSRLDALGISVVRKVCVGDAWADLLAEIPARAGAGSAPRRDGRARTHGRRPHEGSRREGAGTRPRAGRGDPPAPQGALSPARPRDAEGEREAGRRDRGRRRPGEPPRVGSRLSRGGGRLDRRPPARGSARDEGDVGRCRRAPPRAGRSGRAAPAHAEDRGDARERRGDARQARLRGVSRRAVHDSGRARRGAAPVHGARDARGGVARPRPHRGRFPQGAVGRDLRPRRRHARGRRGRPAPREGPDARARRVVHGRPARGAHHGDPGLVGLLPRRRRHVRERREGRPRGRLGGHARTPRGGLGGDRARDGARRAQEIRRDDRARRRRASRARAAARRKSRSAPFTSRSTRRTERAFTGGFSCRASARSSGAGRPRPRSECCASTFSASPTEDAGDTRARVPRRGLPARIDLLRDRPRPRVSRRGRQARRLGQRGRDERAPHVGEAARDPDDASRRREGHSSRCS